MKTLFRTFLVFLVLGGLTTLSVEAKEPENYKRNEQSLEKSAQTNLAAILNINNFTTWQRGNGQGQYGPPALSGDGGIYPRGTKWVLFADGFVWSAKAYLDNARTQPAPVQLIRTGGSTYNVGNEIGWIEGTGASAVKIGSGDPRARIYRIRRDWTTMSDTELRRDAAENFLLAGPQDATDADVATVVAQYVKDWDEWPVANGAPYVERNGIPGYQKPPAFSATFTVDSLISGNYDEPGLAGSDPGSPASQVVWTAFNDLNRGNMILFAGSEPMGLEMQLTIWGYKRTDALGNLYFKRIKFINKGGADVGGGAKGALYLDSMYVAQWSDPDLGAFGDDLCGCDSTLSVGFVYNGNASDAEFTKFNLPPPAVGYDFLAGPTVPGAPTDTAVFDLKKKPGFRNLPMTSFAWFAAGATISDPPFSYEGGLRWNRMLQGFVPDPSTSPLRKYPAPTPAQESNFPLSGDPFAGTGLLDGQGTTWSFAPGDRRIVLNTGPFQLNPGDTQEVVVGVVAGLGADRFSSVAVMKANDAAVQTTYNLIFQVSQPPAAPLVSVTELDERVILEWGSNTGRVTDTETRISQPGAYTFEGYNVYQLPSPGSTLADARRLATYDVVNSTGVILDSEFDLQAGAFLQKPIQFGSNSGIQRYYELTKDAVTGIDKLYNGQEYYIAVTAYSRATQPGFVAALESSPIVLTVRPKKPYGQNVNSALGDTIAITRVAGPSDGFATALVISPTALTGDTYQVRFEPGMLWRLVNITKGDTVLKGQANQNNDNASPIIDGIQVRVSGAPNSVKDFQHVAGPSGPITPPTYAAFAFNNSGFPTTLTTTGPNNPVAPPDRPEADWGGGLWGMHTGGNNADFTFTGRFLPRTFRNDNFDRFIPNDYEMRFTAAGGSAYMAFSTGSIVTVPFELWNIGVGTPNDPSDDFRMIPWIFDENGNDVYDLQDLDHTISGGTNDPYTDWVYFRNPINMSPGSAGYTTEFINRGVAYDGTDGAGNTHPEVIARTVLVNWNGGTIGTPMSGWTSVMPATGNTIRIVATKPNTTADVFQFNTSTYAASKSSVAEKASVDLIKAYPNPYYAYNAAETNRFVRFVTINNLPRKATVRVFNLAGQLVRTLNKDDNTQFLRWDLNNQDNFPVASGVYIAHLDMTLNDGSNATKVIKIAVIQEQEVPDVF